MARTRSKKWIFENERVETLCIQFKRTHDWRTYQRICEESNNLIDSIIRKSRFHQKAPFEDIKQHLFVQFERWIERWKPGPGKVYTYFATCIKHGAISYVSREKLLQQRMAFTDKPLDALASEAPMTSEMNLDSDLADELVRRIEEIRIRWQEPVIQEVLRYTVATVVQGKASTRRREILRTITTAWPIPMDTAKFLLDWSIATVRNTLLDIYEVPLRDEDIIRAVDKYTFIPDIAKAIGWENTRRLIQSFAGLSIRFPSSVQLKRYALLQSVYMELQRDPSPENITQLAKRYRISAGRLQDQIQSIHTSILDGALADQTLFDGVHGFPRDVLEGLTREDDEN